VSHARDCVRAGRPRDVLWSVPALGRWMADDTPLKRALTARSWMTRLYFEVRYVIPDPWRLATSAYERERADRTMAVLSGRRYRTALEVGCGEGIFTSRLLDLCDRVTAVDFSALALRRARRRHASDPRIAIRRLDLVAEDPGGVFDLVVCAELFYYMNHAQFDRAAPRIARCVAHGGDLCLVHGASAHERAAHESGIASCRATSATQIHGRFCRIPGLTVLRDRAFPAYRITLLHREDAAVGACHG
jgi:SAM-dependent methyltransferase